MTGGFIKTPISEMHAFSKESKAIFTDSKAERTSSRFLKESLAIARVSSAFTLAIASSS